MKFKTERCWNNPDRARGRKVTVQTATVHEDPEWK